MKYWQRLSEQGRDWKCHIVETAPGVCEVSPLHPGRPGLLSPWPPASGQRSGPGDSASAGPHGAGPSLGGSVLTAPPAPVAPSRGFLQARPGSRSTVGWAGKGRPCLECRPGVLFLSEKAGGHSLSRPLALRRRRPALQSSRKERVFWGFAGLLSIRSPVRRSPPGPSQAPAPRWW